MKTLAKKLAQSLPPIRQWKGPKTAELLRSPGKFGLGQVPTSVKPDATTNLVCGFCSTGCGLNVHLKDGKAVSLTPSTNYPVNLGMACPKGWEALTPLESDDRATTPMLRKQRGGELEAVSWEEAMETFCGRFKEIQAEHGEESVAFISTGQIVAEEMAFLGALSKFGMGIKHGDGNTRQCMATSVVSYKQSFGFDAPPYTYQDFEESDVIILVGSNLCIAHPIMWQRIERNKHNPEIVVIDPRRTETAVAGTQHYPILPKSDLSFFYGLAKVLIDQGWVDRGFIAEHCNGFAEFETHVASFTPEFVQQQSGISPEQMLKLAETIHKGERVSFWWTMGVNQSHEGVRTAQAIINLALMTANIGRPGTGANSITGQCNAMGSRLFSNTTNLLGGHDFANEAHREKVGAITGVGAENITKELGWTYDQIVDGIHAGKIKGLWVLATNGSHSWIQQDKYSEAMEKLDFLVVQDMYSSTETAQQADLVLPAAGWAEKDGVFINSERRVGLVKKVAEAPGQALSDFNIFRLIAHYWGVSERFAKWSSPEAVFKMLTELSAGQACDMTGISSYQMVDEFGGIQWPCRAEDVPALSRDNQRRLFEDGKFYHPDQKAKFVFGDATPVLEDTDEEFPYVLLTGRGSSAQWHTQSRTIKSEVLRKLHPAEIYVEIHPDDAKGLGIRPNSKIKIVSRRSTVEVTASVTPSVYPGQLFMPMHYAKANKLTIASFDPYSRQPSYKFCAVNITVD
ncbi:molybdopterin oxidoreductase family protein [Rubritalea marina]|uniref:molybdopterin oxidoreductase family protein n=1 Tax=Rubritalea marina TaxID=361055 RepID=UPI00037ABB99|nr:nitrate reductase [Rubritalea marina]